MSDEEQKPKRWWDDLPSISEENLAVAGKYEDPNKFFDAYRASGAEVRRIKESSVEVPPPDAPREVKDAFFARLGRPVNPTEYTIPEGNEFLSPIAEAAHQAGLNQDAWNAVAEAIVKHQPNPLAPLQEMFDGADLSEPELAAAQEFALNHLSEEERTALEQSNLAGLPGIAKTLARLNEMSEQILPNESNPGSGAELQTEQVKAARMREILASKEFNDRNDPMHQELLNEYMKLSMSTPYSAYDPDVMPGSEYEDYAPPGP